jgi:hypothetical protein
VVSLGLRFLQFVLDLGALPDQPQSIISQMLQLGSMGGILLLKQFAERLYVRIKRLDLAAGQNDHGWPVLSQAIRYLPRGQHSGRKYGISPEVDVRKAVSVNSDRAELEFRRRMGDK